MQPVGVLWDASGHIIGHIMRTLGMATWGDEAGVVHVALEKQSQHRLVLRGRDLSDLLDLAVRAIRARAQCLAARPACASTGCRTPPSPVTATLGATARRRDAVHGDDDGRVCRPGRARRRVARPRTPARVGGNTRRSPCGRRHIAPGAPHNPPRARSVTLDLEREDLGGPQRYHRAVRFDCGRSAN